jgi:hypothetical protein
MIGDGKAFLPSLKKDILVIAWKVLEKYITAFEKNNCCIDGGKNNIGK